MKRRQRQRLIAATCKPYLGGCASFILTRMGRSALNSLMNRKFLGLALGLGLAAALGACGETTTTPTTSPSPAMTSPSPAMTSPSPAMTSPAPKTTP